MTDTARIFASDPRIVEVVEYPDGFVPLKYKWRAPRTGYVTKRGGERTPFTYDAKRANGAGPSWVAFSAKRGRLASG